MFLSEYANTHFASYSCVRLQQTTKAQITTVTIANDNIVLFFIAVTNTIPRHTISSRGYFGSPHAHACVLKMFRSPEV